MTYGEARRWLGIYFFVITSLTGAIILLFGGGTFIPLEEADVNHSFQILIPVLLGQLTVIFQWISRTEDRLNEDARCPIPVWSIRLPPIASVVIVVLALTMLFVSNRPETHFVRFGPERFQSTLTFVVSLLNASTVFLVGRLFSSVRDNLER